MPPAAVVVMIYNHCKGYMMYTDLEDTIMTDDIDLDEEYFDADKEYGEDKNPRLGRIVLRIVEKQIDDKEPDFVEKAYVALQKKGYVRKLAKVKLGTALANEIFEVLKYNKPYKEERYRDSIEEVVRERFNEKSVLDIETGREHTIAKRLEEFEELVMDVEDPGAAADLFIQLWPVLKQFVDDNYTRETEDGLRRFSPQQIDKSTDYRMNLYNSIMDSDMAFLNAKRYGDGVRVLGEILDTFAWLPGEDSPSDLDRRNARLYCARPNPAAALRSGGQAASPFRKRAGLSCRTLRLSRRPATQRLCRTTPRWADEV